MMQLEIIQKKIFHIRGQQVMLDHDLAAMYETETRKLKQAVRRNLERFPADFMFELSKEEYEGLRSHFVILKKKSRGTHSKYLPFAFTEQGVAMLASVLSSSKAIAVSIQIVRAFVLLRQYALSHKELTEKLKKLEERYDRKFSDVHDAINYLLKKDQQENHQRERRRIGFKEKG